jgi:hypothetical protein
MLFGLPSPSVWTATGGTASHAPTHTAAHWPAVNQAGMIVLPTTQR